MTYSIVIHPGVQEVLKKLSKKDHPFLIQTKKKITQLVENPESGKPLSNILKGLWRVHIGNYVLIY